MTYKPLENVTIVFSTANITVCADEWGDLYYTTEIPDEFVNQGEPYPRSRCKPIIVCHSNNLIVCWQFTRNCRMTYLST